MATFLLLLAAIFTAQLISWFLFRAARAARDFPDVGPGAVVMHYCPSMKLAALVLPLLVMVLLLVLLDSSELLAAPYRQGLSWIMPLLAIAAGGIAAEAWTRRVVLDEAGIRSHGVLGDVAIAWDEITDVSWNRWAKMIVVRSRDGSVIRINPSLSGLSMFELLLFERVERKRFEQAIPAFLALHRGAY